VAWWAPSGHRLHTDRHTIFDNDFVHLGVALEVKIVIFGPGGVNVGVSSITATAGISVDPLEPMFSAMS
jgi:hypothetical protein